jgi:2-dehydro-3-deoxy-D-arabinonate dehydratase
VRIVQFVVGPGDRRVGRLEGDQIVDLTSGASAVRSSLDLVAWADREAADLTAAVAHLANSGGATFPLTAFADAPEGGARYLDRPIDPPEVWGCGVTYRKSAEFRDEETSGKQGMYDYVYSAPRPEIFFKATASRCVGPNGEIGIRSDSKFTAPEPELGLVIDSRGRILAYTVVNDVSAWDIERENALYLPQSKVFRACCALGPSLVTPDEVADPNALTVIGRIRRRGELIFDDRVETSRIKRPLDELIHYLLRDNPIPAGTVVCTGTGVIASAEHALQDGDLVEVEIPGLGALRNRAMKLVG